MGGIELRKETYLNMKKLYKNRNNHVKVLTHDTIGLSSVSDLWIFGPGEGGTPYNGLYGEAPPERGAFFRLQVYKRVGISQVYVYERVGKSSFGY